MELEFIESVLRVSSPLILAALAAWICERSGMINIALEGMILFGAFAGATTAFFVINHLQFVTEFGMGPWTILLITAMTGLLVGALYSWVVIELDAEQIVAGMALNLVAFGCVPVFCQILFGTSVSTPSVNQGLSLSGFVLWLPLSVGMMLAFVDRYTLGGLWVRFAGENPAALETAGVSVKRVRWACALGAGILASWSGALLSTGLSSSFSKNISAGRGFMALAALILGHWKPIPTVLACLFFGVFEALQIRLQGISSVPVQLVQVLPYIMTLVVLTGFIGRAKPPHALNRSNRHFSS